MIELTYRQCTEDEAKQIIRKNGGNPEKDYRPEDLPFYKYIDGASRQRLRDATPFVRMPQ
jgi:hypothetical protein